MAWLGQPWLTPSPCFQCGFEALSGRSGATLAGGGVAEALDPNAAAAAGGESTLSIPADSVMAVCP